MSDIQVDTSGLAILVPNNSGAFERVHIPEQILAYDFKKIVEAAYSVYLDTGTLNATSIARLAGLGESTVNRILGTDGFKKAITARGVSEGTQLTPEQGAVIALLSDPSIKGGFTTRLKAAGINHGKYRAWLKQPEFRRRIEKLQQGVLKELEGDMLVSLGEAAANGDLNALKYSFELTGKYNPQQQAAIDVRAAIAKILEILQEEIKDPAVLARIGARMQGVAIAPRNSEITNGD